MCKQIYVISEKGLESNPNAQNTQYAVIIINKIMQQSNITHLQHKILLTK
jgi:hypothetical protein